MHGVITDDLLLARVDLDKSFARPNIRFYQDAGYCIIGKGDA